MKKFIMIVFVAGLPFYCPLAATAHEFSAHNVFLAYLKLSEPDNLMPYITIFESRFAPKAVGPQNEFSKSATLGDAEKILAKNLAAFDMNEPFVISTSSNFGEYDFEKRQFDFRPVTAATSFRSGAGAWIEPGDIEVMFTNTKDFHDLPMDPASAEIFLKKNGRGVYVDIEFAPVSALEGSKKIRAKVTKIDVYADPRRTNLIHTVRANSK
jgi:hypothetical protein